MAAGRTRVSGSADTDELLVAIQRLGRLMGSRQVSSRLADAAGADVGQQGVQLLRALLRHGEQPIARLAAAANMDISAVSRQLHPLESSGLVRRATDSQDGRVTLVALTASGRRVATRLRDVGLRHLDDSLSEWSPRDLERLGRLMSRLVDDLERTEIVAPDP